MNLRRMRYLINRLPMARFRVEKAMSTATKTTAPITGMPGGSGISDPVQRGAELLEAARERYRAIREELTEMQQEVRPIIDALDDPLERTVMQMRYLDGVSAREIAYRLSYSERHIFRTLAEAENKIEAAHQGSQIT